jgi:peptide/nickel transport system substrate-binding protein
MSLAINRDEINEIIYLGTGTPTQSTIGQSDKISIMTPELEKYMIEYNPDKADNLLDSIGLKKNSKGFRITEDGKPLVLYISYSTQGAPGRVWELIKEYWDAVGVKVELKEVNTDLYISSISSNSHDVSTWNPPAASPPRFFNVSTAPFTPPFGSYGKTGLEWEKWFLSEGKEGAEPPSDVKKLDRLYKDFLQIEFGNSDYLRIGREMAEIYTTNLYTIATVGDIKAPIIISNRLQNVGEINFKGGDYYYNYAFRACQWYLTD